MDVYFSAQVETVSRPFRSPGQFEPGLADQGGFPSGRFVDCLGGKGERDT